MEDSSTVKNYEAQINKNLEEFKRKWPFERIHSIKLEEYAGSDSIKDSFCRDLEYNYPLLGGIKGGSAFKFGIYYRKGKKAKGTSYKHDNAYSWYSYLSKSNSALEAFNKVRSLIISIIENAQKNDLEAIDKIRLHQFVKWKIAFIYAPKNLIGIYSTKALKYLCNSANLTIKENAPISEYYKRLLEVKNSSISTIEYTVELWNKYRKETTSNQQNTQKTSEVNTEQQQAISEELIDEEEAIQAEKDLKDELNYVFDIDIVRSDKVPPAFNVVMVSNQFAHLLNNLKGEDGQMVGIFGQWGRGKTYFMRHVCNHLNIDYNTGKEKRSNYRYVKFHAWKYQDTHAIWAYLYESLSVKYLGGNWFVKTLKKIWLNVIRYGWNSIRGLIVSYAVLFLLVYVYNFFYGEAKSLKELIETFNPEQVLGFIAGGIGGSVLFIYNKYVHEARQLIKRYTKEITFSEALGLQAEIQKELIALIKAWFWFSDLWRDKIRKNKETKRILLFVDDLDRCSEDKIILLIDAMRVMLEHKEISNKIIIVVAVDEEKLKLAIRNKYKSFLQTIDEEEEHEEKLGQLEEEYMDKLFISGIKLATISEIDRIEYFENLTNGRVQVQEGIQVTESGKGGKAVSNKSDAGENKTTEDGSTVVEEQVDEDNQNNVFDSSTSEEVFEISWDEKTFLTEEVKKMNNSTPRQIRIFYYRYLLGRNILNNISSNKIKEQQMQYLASCIRDKTTMKDSSDLKNINEVVKMVVSY